MRLLLRKLCQCNLLSHTDDCRYCTGALSLEAAVRIAYHRGRLVADLGRRQNKEYAMMSVGISKDEISTYISMLENRKEGLDVEIGVSIALVM